MKQSAIFFLLLSAVYLLGCGNGAPSDTQIATALKQDFKTLEKASLDFTKASLEDIRIGDIRRLDTDPDTYEIQITATVMTRIGSINGIRPCSTIVKLKRINSRWTLVD